jgi:hypothetical protein
MNDHNAEQSLFIFNHFLFSGDDLGALIPPEPWPNRLGPAETDSTNMDVHSSIYEGEFTQMRDTAGVGAKIPRMREPSGGERSLLVCEVGC